MIKNKKINFLMLLMFLFSFSMIIACDSGSNRETDPDIPPPVVGDDDDDVVGDDDDDVVGDDDDDVVGDDDDDVVGDDDDDIVPPVVGMGAIRGSVTSPTGIPLNGVHVRAINIDNTDLQMSSFSGIDCDLILLDGEFCIQNVPAGTYRVLIEKMDDRSSAFDPERYSIFVIAGTTLDFPDEYWNGADESDEDTPSDFEPIVVTNGSTVNGIDIITNDTP